MRSTTLAIAMTLTASFAGTARAQSTTAVGVEAGALSAFEDAILQLGIRAAPPRGGYTSVDFTFATFPDALASGTLLFLMDLGATHGAPSDSSPVFFFPHGGISLLTAGSISGESGGGAAAGYHIGAGLLLRASSHLGIRVDYAYRRFWGLETAASSLTAGLMYAR